MGNSVANSHKTGYKPVKTSSTNQYMQTYSSLLQQVEMMAKVEDAYILKNLMLVDYWDNLPIHISYDGLHVRYKGRLYSMNCLVKCQDRMKKWYFGMIMGYSHSKKAFHVHFLNWNQTHDEWIDLLDANMKIQSFVNGAMPSLPTSFKQWPVELVRVGAAVKPTFSNQIAIVTEVDWIKNIAVVQFEHPVVYQFSKNPSNQVLVSCMFVSIYDKRFDASPEASAVDKWQHRVPENPYIHEIKCMNMISVIQPFINQYDSTDKLDTNLKVFNQYHSNDQLDTNIKVLDNDQTHSEHSEHSEHSSDHVSSWIDILKSLIEKSSDDEFDVRLNALYELIQHKSEIQIIKPGSEDQVSSVDDTFHEVKETHGVKDTARVLHIQNWNCLLQDILGGEVGTRWIRLKRLLKTMARFKVDIKNLHNWSEMMWILLEESWSNNDSENMKQLLHLCPSNSTVLHQKSNQLLRISLEKGHFCNVIALLNLDSVFETIH